MTSIRFRRGNKADLPALAPSGMPLWCEDTKQLYLGTGDNVHLINDQNNNFANDLVTYSVNSGNTDSNGYADLIWKVSDAEIAFKIGGSYPNMVITFPNGRHYEVSLIPNITGLIDNALYTFVIFEENLTLLEDGTYSAIVTPIKVGYTSGITMIPIKSNNSGTIDGSGWTASASAELGTFYAYKAVNGELSPIDGWETSALTAWWKITKDSGTFNLARIAISANEQYNASPKDFTIRDQADNVLATFTDIVYEPMETKYFDVSAIGISAIKINITANNGNPSGIKIAEVGIYEYFSGGKITEDYKFPEAYLSSSVPAMTSNTAPSGVVSASTIHAASYDAWKAFNGSNAIESDCWITANNVHTGWLQYQFTVAKTINFYAVTSRNCPGSETQSPKDWTLQGSNDGINWTILDTQTNQTLWAVNETRSFNFSNTTAYLYYRLNVTAYNGYTSGESPGGILAIGELKLYETVSIASGDLHVLINQRPLKPYIRQNSGWIEKQFVKIGQAQKISGLLGTPISYAFNGKYQAVQAVSYNNGYLLSDNIGTLYKNIILKFSVVVEK